MSIDSFKSLAIEHGWAYYLDVVYNIITYFIILQNFTKLTINTIAILYWCHRVKMCICVICRHDFRIAGPLRKKKGEKNKNAEMEVTSGVRCIGALDLLFSLSLTLSLSLPLASVSSLSISPSLSISTNKKQYFSDERFASGTRYDFASGIRASLFFDTSYKFGSWHKKKRDKNMAPSVSGV